tara:strand:- start:662 stop:967 length:306 start_codon:yes stop_codon:yes gene_type:complete
MEQSDGVVSVKLTLKELNEIVTDAQMEAEEIMRNKIVKYINEGYTTNGILFMLGQFNLVTGRKHESEVEIDGYKDGETIQVMKMSEATSKVLHSIQSEDEE